MLIIKIQMNSMIFIQVMLKIHLKATQTFRRRMQRLHMNGIPIKATTSQTAQNTIIHM